MNNYPKALEEFLNRDDIPKEFKESFDKFASTDAGKEILDGCKNLSEIYFFKQKGSSFDGHAFSDKEDGNKLKIRIGDNFLKRKDASSERFAFTLMHELRHVGQLDKLNGNKMPKGYEASCLSVIESAADFKAWQAFNQVNENQDNKAYKEIFNYLKEERGYSSKALVNFDYYKMKEDFAKNNDLEIEEFKNEHPDNEKVQALMANSVEELSSNIVRIYEIKVGEGNNNSSREKEDIEQARTMKLLSLNKTQGRA